MNSIIEVIRKTATGVICALLALQPATAAAGAVKVRTAPVRTAVPSVGAVASSLGSVHLAQVSSLAPLSAAASLNVAEAISAQAAPQARVAAAATAASPWAAQPIQSAVLRSDGRVQVRTARVAPTAAAAAQPQARKPVERTLGVMRDAVANLPKLPSATIGAAHSAGLALHDALTGDKSRAGSGAVAAPSALFGPSRSGLKAAANAGAEDGADFLAALSAAQEEDPYRGPANAELQAQVEKAGEKINALRAEVGKVIVGQQDMVDSIIVAMIGGEHVLLEGLPGIAKTLTVNTFADATGAEWSRIQMTPDLLPKNITGGKILQIAPDGKRTMEVQHGPVYGKSMVLADEINRATPRTQSALLEIMQEKQISIDGVTYSLTEDGKPFLMLATQNPVEQEGTNPLPEAQQDRFMYKVTLDQPGRADRMLVNEMQRRQQKPKAEKVVSLAELAQARTVAEEIYMAAPLREYVQNIVEAALDPSAIGIGQPGLVRVAMITRASIVMEKAARINAMLNGRSWVTEQDVRDITPKILRHRILLDFSARDMTTDQLISRILERTPVTEAAFKQLQTRTVQAAAAAAAQDEAPARSKFWWLKWAAVAAVVAGLAGAAVWFWPVLMALIV